MENLDEKEQRRKKIKELEASLFGAENQWTTFSTNTDLPELKNVNEYASSLATAQTTTQSRLKTAQKGAFCYYFVRWKCQTTILLT